MRKEILTQRRGDAEGEKKREIFIFE